MLPKQPLSKGRLEPIFSARGEPWTQEETVFEHVPTAFLFALVKPPNPPGSQEEVESHHCYSWERFRLTTNFSPQQFFSAPPGFLSPYAKAFVRRPGGESEAREEACTAQGSAQREILSATTPEPTGRCKTRRRRTDGETPSLTGRPSYLCRGKGLPAAQKPKGQRGRVSAWCCRRCRWSRPKRWSKTLQASRSRHWNSCQQLLGAPRTSFCFKIFFPCKWWED